jgi:hypothetical protein
LVGRCFNCLHEDHIAIACKFLSRCLRCDHESHQAYSYKGPRSPDATGLLPRHSRPTSGKLPRLALVVVINWVVGDIALAEPWERCSRSHSSTPPGQESYTRGLLFAALPPLTSITPTTSAAELIDSPESSPPLRATGNSTHSSHTCG